MRACPSCYALNQDDARFCAECQSTMEPIETYAKGKEPSTNALAVAAIRRDYASRGLTSADLTEQQWYNVCKFYPSVAAHCKRARPTVGPEHPLDATASPGFGGALLRRRARAQARAQRRREPGEEG